MRREKISGSLMTIIHAHASRQGDRMLFKSAWNVGSAKLRGHERERETMQCHGEEVKIGCGDQDWVWRSGPRRHETPLSVCPCPRQPDGSSSSGTSILSVIHSVIFHFKMPKRKLELSPSPLPGKPGIRISWVSVAADVLRRIPFDPLRIRCKTSWLSYQN